MKQNFRKLLMLVIAVSIWMPSFAAFNDKDAVPMDTTVRYGKLPNGLTYYIRHNAEPKERADFYIAQKVGSILENDKQRGLAHFLEHMAFNGTTHYPGKSMLEYLQDNGMRFGADINAYTGFDETVYYVSNVPTTKTQLMDSVMLVLYDWAGEISLQNEEIEKERGVIHEEWRTRGDARMRMFEKQLPVMFKGSRYANRMPIGTMEVVMNFKPDDLRAYYETWYRPDQQGIIIVGDFDAAKMEAKVKELFGTLKMPENPKKREYFPVPDNKEPIYSLYTDPEASSTVVYLFFKHDKTPREELNTMKKYKDDALNILVQIMLGDRFSELALDPASPFTKAYGADGDYYIALTKDAYSMMAMAKEGKSAETLGALLTEAQRIRLHGFNQSELDRAKSQFLTSVHNQYLEKDKKKNYKYSNDFVDHFTKGGYLTDITFDYEALNKMLPEVTLEDINNYFKPMITDENIVVSISGPDKKEISYPDSKEVNKALKTILSQNIAPYIDNVNDLPLIEKEPVPGKILSESYDKELGATEMKLSNGATVYLKPTDFKNDEIIMSGISFGGNWAYKGNEALDLKALNSAIAMSSLGNYTRTDLNKYLADKNVSMRFVMGDPTENISGVTVKKDLETLLQLTYLYFTDIRKDEKNFEVMKSNLKSELSLQQNSPRKIFSDSISSVVYNRNPLYTDIKPDEIDKINYDNVLKIARERLANAGDYTFSFVGNFNTDSIKPYIEKYIASLPDNGRRDSVTYNVGPQTGIHKNEFRLAMETPKTSVFGVISGELPYNLKNHFMLDMLSAVMDIVYTNTIREEEGGTYGVSTSTSLSQYNDQWTFSYVFDTNGEKQEQLNERALEEFMNVLKNGADIAEFKKVKEAEIKQYEISLRNNNYWTSVLRNKGIGIDIFTGYEDLARNITLDEFNGFLKKLYNDRNFINIKMIGTAK